MVTTRFDPLLSLASDADAEEDEAVSSAGRTAICDGWDFPPLAACSAAALLCGLMREYTRTRSGVGSAPINKKVFFVASCAVFLVFFVYGTAPDDKCTKRVLAHGA